MNLGVIVRKEDLYAVGLVKDTNNYIEIADIEYGSYNRITKKEKKLSVTVNNIADNVKTLDTFITSFDEKTNSPTLHFLFQKLPDSSLSEIQ